MHESLRINHSPSVGAAASADGQARPRLAKTVTSHSAQSFPAGPVLHLTHGLVGYDSPTGSGVDAVPPRSAASTPLLVATADNSHHHHHSEGVCVPSSSRAEPATVPVFAEHQGMRTTLPPPPLRVSVMEDHGSLTRPLGLSPLMSTPLSCGRRGNVHRGLGGAEASLTSSLCGYDGQGMTTMSCVSDVLAVTTTTQPPPETSTHDGTPLACTTQSVGSPHGRGDNQAAYRRDDDDDDDDVAAAVAACPAVVSGGAQAHSASPAPLTTFVLPGPAGSSVLRRRAASSPPPVVDGDSPALPDLGSRKPRSYVDGRRSQVSSNDHSDNDCQSSSGGGIAASSSAVVKRARLEGSLPEDDGSISLISGGAVNEEAVGENVAVTSGGHTSSTLVVEASEGSEIVHSATSISQQRRRHGVPGEDEVVAESTSSWSFVSRGVYTLTPLDDETTLTSTGMLFAHDPQHPFGLMSPQNTDMFSALVSRVVSASGGDLVSGGGGATTAPSAAAAEKSVYHCEADGSAGGEECRVEDTVLAPRCDAGIDETRSPPTPAAIPSTVTPRASQSCPHGSPPTPSSPPQPTVPMGMAALGRFSPPPISPAEGGLQVSKKMLSLSTSAAQRASPQKRALRTRMQSSTQVSAMALSGRRHGSSQDHADRARPSSSSLLAATSSHSPASMKFAAGAGVGAAAAATTASSTSQWRSLTSLSSSSAAATATSAHVFANDHITEYYHALPLPSAFRLASQSPPVSPQPQHQPRRAPPQGHSYGGAVQVGDSLGSFTAFTPPQGDLVAPRRSQRSAKPEDETMLRTPPLLVDHLVVAPPAGSPLTSAEPAGLSTRSAPGTADAATPGGCGDMNDGAAESGLDAPCAAAVPRCRAVHYDPFAHTTAAHGGGHGQAVYNKGEGHPSRAGSPRGPVPVSVPQASPMAVNDGTASGAQVPFGLFRPLARGAGGGPSTVLASDSFSMSSLVRRPSGGLGPAVGSMTGFLEAAGGDSDLYGAWSAASPPLYGQPSPTEPAPLRRRRSGRSVASVASSMGAFFQPSHGGSTLVVHHKDGTRDVAAAPAVPYMEPDTDPTDREGRRHFADSRELSWSFITSATPTSSATSTYYTSSIELDSLVVGLSEMADAVADGQPTTQAVVSSADVGDKKVDATDPSTVWGDPTREPTDHRLVCHLYAKAPRRFHFYGTDSTTGQRKARYRRFLRRHRRTRAAAASEPFMNPMTSPQTHASPEDEGGPGLVEAPTPLALPVPEQPCGRSVTAAAAAPTSTTGTGPLSQASFHLSTASLLFYDDVDADALPFIDHRLRKYLGAPVWYEDPAVVELDESVLRVKAATAAAAAREPRSPLRFFQQPVRAKRSAATATAAGAPPRSLSDGRGAQRSGNAGLAVVEEEEADEAVGDAASSASLSLPEDALFYVVDVRNPAKDYRLEDYFIRCPRYTHARQASLSAVDGTTADEAHRSQGGRSQATTTVASPSAPSVPDTSLASACLHSVSTPPVRPFSASSAAVKATSADTASPPAPQRLPRAVESGAGAFASLSPNQLGAGVIFDELPSMSRLSATGDDFSAGAAASSRLAGTLGSVSLMGGSATPSPPPAPSSGGVGGGGEAATPESSAYLSEACASPQQAALARRARRATAVGVNDDGHPRVLARHHRQTSGGLVPAVEVSGHVHRRGSLSSFADRQNSFGSGQYSLSPPQLPLPSSTSPKHTTGERDGEGSAVVDEVVVHTTPGPNAGTTGTRGRRTRRHTHAELHRPTGFVFPGEGTRGTAAGHALLSGLVCIDLGGQLTYVDPRTATGAVKLLVDAALCQQHPPPQRRPSQGLHSPRPQKQGAGAGEKEEEEREATRRASHHTLMSSASHSPTRPCRTEAHRPGLADVTTATTTSSPLRHADHRDQKVRRLFTSPATTASPDQPTVATTVASHLVRGDIANYGEAAPQRTAAPKSLGRQCCEPMQLVEGGTSPGDVRQGFRPTLPSFQVALTSRGGSPSQDRVPRLATHEVSSARHNVQLAHSLHSSVTSLSPVARGLGPSCVVSHLSSSSPPPALVVRGDEREQARPAAGTVAQASENGSDNDAHGAVGEAPPQANDKPASRETTTTKATASASSPAMTLCSAASSPYNDNKPVARRLLVASSDEPSLPAPTPPRHADVARAWTAEHDRWAAQAGSPPTAVAMAHTPSSWTFLCETSSSSSGSELGSWEEAAVTGMPQRGHRASLLTPTRAAAGDGADTTSTVEVPLRSTHSPTLSSRPSRRRASGGSAARDGDAHDSARRRLASVSASGHIPPLPVEVSGGGILVAKSSFRRQTQSVRAKEIEVDEHNGADDGEGEGASRLSERRHDRAGPRTLPLSPPGTPGAPTLSSGAVRGEGESHFMLGRTRSNVAEQAAARYTAAARSVGRSPTTAHPTVSYSAVAGGGAS